MDSFPLTVNGKIDRKALLLLTETMLLESDTDVIYAAPQSEEEIQMCELWQSILNVDKKVGMDDDFFELGGHSLLAMELAMKVKCDVREIMANSTVSGLLRHLGESNNVNAVRAMDAVIDALPESDMTTRHEQRMLYIYLSDPSSNSYNIPFHVQYNAASGINLFGNVTMVLESIPILRTRFVGGEAICDVIVPIIDLKKEDIDVLAPFDLEKGPLCRFGVDEDNKIIKGCIHHSIADGRSMKILLEAVGTGVVKESTKKFSVRRYASLEASEETTNKYATSLEEWKKMLGDTPSRLEVDIAPKNSIRTSGDNNTAHESNGKSNQMTSLLACIPNRSAVTLDCIMVEKIGRYCQEKGISMFSLALGTLHHLMRAYSRESFAIGVAHDVRPRQFRDTVGMLVNTVLVPFEGGKNGGRESLKDLHRRWTNDILQHAETPYDMVTSLGYGCNICLAFNTGIFADSRGDGRTEDSQSQLYSEKYFSMDSNGPGEQMADDDRALKSKFDLTVMWSEASVDSSTGGDGMIVSFESGIGKWPGLEDRFLQILQGLINDPQKSAPPTALLPSERSQVLEWGKGETTPLRKECLHELFEIQARIHPDAIALMDKEGSLTMTYAELDERSEMLGLKLQGLGAKTNSFIGLLTSEKSFDLYIGVLGILKSGAAYVPMDPVRYPPERLKFMIEDTDMDLLVTVSEYEGQVLNLGTRLDTSDKVVCVDAHDEEGVCGEEKARLCCKSFTSSSPLNYAYMIYTSGTTGKPKGVICNHMGPSNIVTSACSNDFFLNCTPGVDILGCSSPSIFDFSLLEIFGTLGAGLTISVDIKHCTMLMCTPSIAPLLLADETNAQVHSLLAAGEACPHGLEDSCELFRNEYGPTECSILTSISSSSSHIGRPLPNVLCYVVHPDNGELCPPGVSGELWIGGVGVSHGYHKRPDLTAEKFIDNPFIDSPDSLLLFPKLYKSGDRVKWNDKGEIVYLGRFDHQVKVNGYRIELGEIQTEIEKQAGVSGALVMVHKDKLVAYVTPKLVDAANGDGNDNNIDLTTTSGMSPVTEEGLKAVLSSDNCQLASYMVPWRIIVMDSFPLTVNGKIDRKALLSLNNESNLRRNVEICSDIVLPQSSTEIILCEMFRGLLDIESSNVIGIDMEFTELGGHSLLVMDAVLQIRKHFGIDSFSPRQFLSFGTVRNIASFIDSFTINSNKKNIESEIDSTEDEFIAGARENEKFFREQGMFFSAHQFVKVLSVLCFWVLLWLVLLPSFILISGALERRFSGVDLVSAYSTYITLLFLSLAVILLNFAVLSWMLCILLQKVILKDQIMIRRGSLQYFCWYNFDRFWFVTQLFAEAAFGGTIFLPLFCKLYGANIGKNNFFEDMARLRLPFMLTTGDNVVVESNTKLETIQFAPNGDIMIGMVTLQENVVIGSNAHIGLGSTIGNSSFIKALSIVPDHVTIKSGCIIEGTKTVENLEEYNSLADFAAEDQPASVVEHVLSLIILQLPTTLFILCNISMLVGVFKLSTDQGINVYYSLLIFTCIYPIIVAVGQLLTGILIHALRLLLNGGRAKCRCTYLYSRPFMRQWLASKLHQTTAGLTEGSTILSRCTSRLMGANIDVRCVFSPLPEEPHLTSTGKNVFCANGVKLRNSCFYPGGIARFGRVDIGKSSMILDRSVVEIDNVVEDNVLVASLTVVTKKSKKSHGSLLIGNPAFQMINTNQNETQNIKGEPLYQALLIYLINTYFSLIFVSIPVLCSFYSNAYIICLITQSDYSLLCTFGISFALLPITLGIGILWLLGISLATKWLIIGNFRRFERMEVISVESSIFFYWELANQLVHMTCSLPLQLVNEYWLTATFWKWMGATIGKRTMIDSNVLLFEADFLHVGDDCQIREEATLLCHKFNNGGLEFGPIVIPSKTLIGDRTVVLPGCKILDENVQLMPLTHVLPSEELTAGRWHGSPAEKVDIESGKHQRNDWRGLHWTAHCNSTQHSLIV